MARGEIRDKTKMLLGQQRRHLLHKFKQKKEVQARIKRWNEIKDSIKKKKQRLKGKKLIYDRKLQMYILRAA
jgi:hypothetical protein